LSNLDFTIKENSWLEKIKRTTQGFNKWQRISSHTLTFGSQQEIGSNVIKAG
jgi:hypothetical protein